MSQTTTQIIQERLKKRAMTEIDPAVAHRIKLLCLLKNIPIKEFASQIINKELEPCKSWIDSFMQLKANSAQET